MKQYKSLLICLVVLVLGAGWQTARCDPPVPPEIISHQDGDTVCRGAETTVQATGGVAPLSWSGHGAFNPGTGDEVVWTAPASGDTATVTVTDQPSQSDSVTLHLANVIHVDKSRSGGDGSTWDNAFKYLQDALAVATAGSEIWVAAGTYWPDEDKNNPDGTHNGFSTFTLVPGAGLYGGFVGNETTRSDARDRLAHETILSGDLHRSTPPTLDAGNCNHVVSCTSGTDTTVLDGFTITMGYSDYYQCDGAGIDLQYCSPKIVKCLIKQNKAWGNDGDGAGMHCFRASPTVTNCVFRDNIAGDDGGGLCNKNGSNGTFTNCVFYNNHTEGAESSSHGGGIFNTRGEPAGYIGCTPTFINCVVASNYTSASGDGGGAADNGADVTVTWINCTFYGNTAADDGGGLAARDGAASIIKNCIFWDDSAAPPPGGEGPELAPVGSPLGTITVTYSAVKGGWAGATNTSSDPKFLNTGDLDGADNRFGTTDDGLEIIFNSACIDSGDGTAITELYDVAGNARKLDDLRTANTGTGTPPVDRGAYELKDIVVVEPHLIYPRNNTQMTVFWRLDRQRTCTLRWGTDTSYTGTPVTPTELTGAPTYRYSGTITGLTPGTKYYYLVDNVGSGSFYAAPPGTNTSLNFLVYGDTRGDASQPSTTYYEDVCNQMVNSYTTTPAYQTVAFHVGDWVQNGESDSEWLLQFFNRQRRKAMELQANVPIMGCMGNHESMTIRFPSSLLSKYWPYASANWYSFDYGPAHFTVIHDYRHESQTITFPDLTAVHNDIANSTKAWKFVILHAPGYSASGGHPNYTPVRTEIQPICADHGVDIVFTGHNHYYSRSEVGTAPAPIVRHITTGGGGTPSLHTPSSTYDPPYNKFQSKNWQFCRVEINGTTNQMTVYSISRTGGEIEHFHVQH